MGDAAPRLSKSRFTAGWQCTKLLWWKVHEPQAKELQPDIVLQDRFDQGRQVGEIAQTRFPGGVLIEGDHRDPSRAERTREAIASGAPAIFEATFIEDGLYVAVDVLLKDGDGWVVIEVKSSSEQKDEHIPDAAVQAYVVAQAGLTVKRVEIMHLSKGFRHPDTGELFERTDVSAEVAAFLPQVPGLIAEFREAIAGPLPDRKVGVQCWEPRECPFFGRCWPPDRDHIRHLYWTGGKATVSWMQQGVHHIQDIPAGKKLNVTQQRQVRAIAEDRLIVEPTLGDALAPALVTRVGFLDFETIQRAVPVWNGQKPWEQTAVQYSYHERRDDGTYRHDAFLAEGPDDPREEIADFLIASTVGAEAILTWSHFEKTRIKDLAEQLPHRADELNGIVTKLVDLLPIVRNNVYHPDFKGSFSIKDVLKPLVPELSYDDLIIMDGMVASVTIARLLFFQHLVDDRDKTRRDLLEYCERDTWAMVKLLERLEALGVSGER